MRSDGLNTKWIVALFALLGTGLLYSHYSLSSSISGAVRTAFEAKRSSEEANRTAVTAKLHAQSETKKIHAQVQGFTASALESWNRNDTSSAAKYPFVPTLPQHIKKRIVVTGGAGFVGSNLVDVLMLLGHSVTVVDNLFTGRKENIEHWLGHPNFDFHQHDITEPLHLEGVDQIYHLACPASPPHYMYNPIKTIKTSAVGTINMLGLAKRQRATLLFTSTSEVYGDPEVHPQKETYWGHVNPIGPRACYDEGKRVAETMCYAYQSEEGVNVRVARIFNTYGPRMHPHDGRVVSNFIIQSLSNKNLTVYGDGKQTRSFQYVSDLVKGLILLMESDLTLPCNIGNPEETTIGQFAEKIRNMVNPSSKVIYLAANEDDPKKRKPDISRANEFLSWAPAVKVDDGLKLAVEYFSTQLQDLSLPGTGGKSASISEDSAQKQRGRIWIGHLADDVQIKEAVYATEEERAERRKIKNLPKRSGEDNYVRVRPGRS